MSQIIFKSKEHRDFFLEMMSKCKVNDCYHRAFFGKRMVLIRKVTAIFVWLVIGS